ncbi:hypothetical protein [Kineosporia succinea]|uniref:Acyl carrier protein n=1 Tax=Kineosporia succinea TaxID=84632 RepID=A0ABT9NW05_9ACTN|nr:hypothetical protein [Kineosporia succinea]MDP9824608.1 acyl carrier protein [Kineosporia succinea]
MPDPVVVDLTVVELDSAVRAVVAQQLRLPTAELSPGAPVRLDLDEAERPQLLTAMGEVFDATFPDDFLDGVHTVADLSDAVRVSLRA